MTKRFVEDDENFDENGILKDGKHASLKMFMKDSITTDAQIALDATEALKLRDAAIFAASRKPGFHYADSAVDSRAESRAANRQASYDAYDEQLKASYFKQAPVATDAVDPRQAWHAARDASRAADASDTRRATIDAAYAAVDEELQNAWRKPAQF
jgi:hypothetical protein